MSDGPRALSKHIYLVCWKVQVFVFFDDLPHLFCTKSKRIGRDNSSSITNESARCDRLEEPLSQIIDLSQTQL